jgi:sRNA-binding protein
VRALTEQAAQSQLKEAYQQYYSQKGSAKELRQAALENLAEAIAERGNTTHAQVLKSLREWEKQRTTAKKIRYLQGKLRAGSTTMVATVDQEGNKTDLTKQQDIEQAILDNNLSKFLQSSKSPFY